MKKFNSEEELASDVEKWLTDQGYGIYPEVCIGNKRADIVAVKRDIVWVVETKMSFTLSLIEQAMNWNGLATMVSVAIPKSKNRNGRRLAEIICKERGIGVIYASPLEDEGYFIRGSWQTKQPKWNGNARTKYIISNLYDEQKKYPSGNATNQYYTPFRSTCDKLKKFLDKNPGSTIKEIISEIDHHYASDTSARSSLLHWINQGVIDDVKVDTSSKPYKFYLKDDYVHED